MQGKYNLAAHAHFALRRSSIAKAATKASTALVKDCIYRRPKLSYVSEPVSHNQRLKDPSVAGSAILVFDQEFVHRTLGPGLTD